MPFNTAMRTFGIDETVPQEYLLSSKLAALNQAPPMIDNMIPVSYVSEYTSEMFAGLSQKKKSSIIPGYVSIDGAELLQQS